MTTHEEQKEANHQMTFGVTNALQANYANPFQNQSDEGLGQPSAKVDFNFKIHENFIKKCPNLFYL